MVYEIANEDCLFGQLQVAFCYNRELEKGQPEGHVICYRIGSWVMQNDKEE
ncbi:19999_t:CDS:2, partial [Dentiscutata erythropus]